MSKLLAPLGFAALVACSANNLGSPAIPATQTAVASQARQNFEGRVYVSDRTCSCVLEYPAGVNDPAPIKSVPFPNVPRFMAKDARGNVYLSFPGASKVEVYDSTLTLKLNTINTVDPPNGLAVDSKGNLYVVEEGAINEGSVSEYSYGAKQPKKMIRGIPGYGIVTVAIDGSDRVYASVYASTYNTIMRWDGNTWTNLNRSGAGPSNVFFDSWGNMVIDSISVYATYKPPAFTRTGFHYLGLGYDIWFGSTGQDGKMYLPVSGPTNEVLVVPSTGIGAVNKITTGLSYPQAAIEVN